MLILMLSMQYDKAFETCNTTSYNLVSRHIIQVVGLVVSNLLYFKAIQGILSEVRPYATIRNCIALYRQVSTRMWRDH